MVRLLKSICIKILFKLHPQFLLIYQTLSIMKFNIFYPFEYSINILGYLIYN